MIIAGFQPLTLIDYPQKLASTIFTAGCNFRCQYCHNPELIFVSSAVTAITKNSIIDYLKTRVGKLDGVVITGGEPTIHYDKLKDFLLQIKALGLAIKLDTNGSYPAVLENLINSFLIDYIAMDIKAPFHKYEFVAGVQIDTCKLKKSIELIMNSNLDYEFRVTMVPGLVDFNDLVEIAKVIQGSKLLVLQNFQNQKTLNPNLKTVRPYQIEQLSQFSQQLTGYITNCLIR